MREKRGDWRRKKNEIAPQYKIGRVCVFVVVAGVVKGVVEYFVKGGDYF